MESIPKTMRAHEGEEGRVSVSVRSVVPRRSAGRGRLSAGCTKVAAGGPRAGRHPWTQPGVLRFSEASDPKNLNPMLDSASPTLDLSMFIYSWTIRYDAQGAAGSRRAARDPDDRQR